MRSSSPLSRIRRTTAATALALVTLGAGGVVTAAPAEAAGSLGQRAVAEARTHVGKPYVYGAVGPSKFDCSGFTLYVYRKLGRSLPHSSSGQYTARGVRHVSASAKAVGDLIFMKSSSGRITHVGIYAGGNKWYVAPKSGDHVKLQTLYSSRYVVGRLA